MQNCYYPVTTESTVTSKAITAISSDSKNSEYFNFNNNFNSETTTEANEETKEGVSSMEINFNNDTKNNAELEKVSGLFTAIKNLFKVFDNMFYETLLLKITIL